MSDLKLGAIIDANQQRDAIHIAVAPVIATQILAPGDHIGFLPGSTEEVAAASTAATPIGIVDPFFKGYVQVGDRFWMFLYPQTITSLRHDWTHPAFASRSAPAPVPDVSPSERWLREYAEQMDLTYTRLLDGAREYVESLKRGGYGEYIIDGGRYEGECVPDEFWPHYENVTGTKVADGHRGSFFSCACS